MNDVARLLKVVDAGQARNGSFPSFSSADCRGFSEASVTHTAFMASLIAACIANARGAAGIREKALRFLESQKSAAGSWNYVERGSPSAQRMSYPDDLDDTACALLALSGAERKGLKGHALAGLVNRLIACEAAPGGPYHTWIVSPADRARWSDIDPAVNANVAYLLALQGVELEGLSRRVDEAAEKLDLSSFYYHSPLAVSYFISRFYKVREDRKSPGAKRLSERLSKHIAGMRLADGSWGDPLATALAASTLMNLGASAREVAKAVSHLRKANPKAEAFYIEEKKAGKTYYAGCPALTAAFMIEALCSYEAKASYEATGLKLSRKADAECASVMKKAAVRLAKLGDPMGRQAKAALKAISDKGLDRLIIPLPYRFAEALAPRKFDRALLDELALANLLGWMAYTVQDDVLDGDSDVSLLPLSNVLMRSSYEILSSHAERPSEKAFVRKAFDGIDAANAWEHAYARPGKDPAYGDLSVLAEKSYGHALGPILLLMKAGFGLGTKDMKAAQAFFEHYIIARQLNDDAHDWEKDLARGRLIPISANLMKEHPKLAGQDLARAFWEGHIEEAVGTIRFHIGKARASMQKSALLRKSAYLETLLAPLDKAAELALGERDKAIAFAEEYNKSRR